MLVNIIGAIGSLLSAIIFVPQAVDMWKLRKEPERLEGVSLLTSSLALVNSVIWVWYAWLAKAYWSGAPSLVGFPALLVVVLLKVRSIRQLSNISQTRLS